MTKIFRNLLTAAALLMPAFAHTAFAADAPSYPRTIGSGENVTVEYGTAPRGNIVGGGAFEIVGHNSEGQAELRYLDPSMAQQPRPGMVPVSVGSGEGAEIVWVPGADDRWLMVAATR